MDSGQITITSTELQRNFGEILHRITRHSLLYKITNHGRDEMVIMTAARYDELVRLERVALASIAERTLQRA